MHAFYLKRQTCCGPTATQSSRRDNSPRWIRFTCAAMCTPCINIQSFLNCGLHDWPHLHIPKTHRLQIQRAESWNETQCGCRVGWCGAEPIVFVCCVHPAGLPVCSLPGVEKGLAVASQPWPAGLSCPQGAKEQEAIARLHLQVVNLTSYCTDTSIIVIKGQSNLFIYWFPTGRRQD